MGFLNKSNTAPQRQYSIESLVIDPSVSTPSSSSDAWLSQYPNASSREEMPSPEQERHYLGKRSSVFKLRSRSNTATSAASTTSISSTMLSSDGSYRSSQDFRHLSGLDFSGTKRSRFTRGKRGKRLSDAVSLTPEIEEEEEEDGGSRKMSVLRKIRRNTNQFEGSGLQSLKHRISRPFDFQHLTHSEKDQFGQLEGASEHELVAEYWAVRAGQAPRSEVRGMKTEDLHFTNFSSENLTTVDSRTSSVLSFRSPPQSPRGGLQQSESPESGRRTIRPARSVESFSQPGIHSRLHRHTHSATPSPRVPSFQQATLLDESPEDPAPARRSPRTRSNRASGVWDRFAPMISHPVETKLEPIADEHDYFGHAVTTPDDSAIHPISPAFTPDLEDVAEEPERFVDPRPAPLPPIGSPRPMACPLAEAFSPQRTQFSRIRSRGSSFASPSKPPTARTSMTRPISQMSDTLGSPTLPRRNSILRPTTVRRRSNTWRVIEESWEDDVDYIYENALEADCDFDWEHASDDGVYEDRDRTPEQEEPPPAATTVAQRRRSQSFTSGEEPGVHGGYFHGAFRPSLLMPSHMSIPGLESGSAISASTADTGVRTPSDFYSAINTQHLPYAEGEGFMLSPSLLVPADYKETSRDDMYHGILSEYEGSDRHFPIIDANQSVPSSTRSSRIRSSKRSSYDSSLMSSATSGHGSGSFGSPIRRSASSSGSIPELVHSRRSRKDFSIVVDKLSEQVASFGPFGEDENKEEDDDTTPPGRAPQNITFFAADEDDHAPQPAERTLENELKASLELARDGSTGSSRAPAHHRHVASDGAAQILASVSSVPELKQAPKKAKRARASSSPYLSLFPTPPKYTPVASPISPNYPKNP